MLRLAPSSTNGQPWVVVKDGDLLHFFARHKPGTSDDTALIKRLDVGIGLSHFHQIALSQGLRGTFVDEAPTLGVPGDMHYIVSYRCE